MKFAVGSLITWRPLRRCGDSKLCRFVTYQGFRCLNHSISTDIPAKKQARWSQRGSTCICFWIEPESTIDRRGTHISKILIHFPTSWTTSKMDDFGTIFLGEGLQVHQHKPGGTKVPTRGMAPAEVQVGKARRPIWNEKNWLVVKKQRNGGMMWNGWGKILRSQVFWWLECNMIIWYMFRLFRWYNFVKHEISFYPKGQNSAVLSSLVWWRTHTDLQNTDSKTWKNINCIEE